MSEFYLESDRLVLRELTVLDAKDFFKLNENPNVIKYTGDKSFSNKEEAVKFLENYDAYSKFGMGRWAVVSKVENSFLGWCGLKFDSESHEIDLGFRFFEEHWGKGYATEASRVCLKYAFEVLELEILVGRVMSENCSSIRVLEKLGFKFEKMLNRNDAYEWKQYVITKEEYYK
jgi:RimJ/RimL family protein N-acetyltransferase